MRSRAVLCMGGAILSVWLWDSQIWGSVTNSAALQLGVSCSVPCSRAPDGRWFFVTRPQILLRILLLRAPDCTIALHNRNWTRGTRVTRQSRPTRHMPNSKHRMCMSAPDIQAIVDEFFTATAPRRLYELRDEDLCRLTAHLRAQAAKFEQTA